MRIGTAVKRRERFIGEELHEDSEVMDLEIHKQPPCTSILSSSSTRPSMCPALPEKITLP